MEECKCYSNFHNVHSGCKTNNYRPGSINLYRLVPYYVITPPIQPIQLNSSTEIMRSAHHNRVTFIMATCRYGYLPLWLLAVMATCRYGYFPLWLLAVMATSSRYGYLPLWLLPVMATSRYGYCPLWLLPVMATSRYGYFPLRLLLSLGANSRYVYF